MCQQQNQAWSIYDLVSISRAGFVTPADMAV